MTQSEHLGRNIFWDLCSLLNNLFQSIFAFSWTLNPPGSIPSLFPWSIHVYKQTVIGWVFCHISYGPIRWHGGKPHNSSKLVNPSKGVQEGVKKLFCPVHKTTTTKLNKDGLCLQASSHFCAWHVWTLPRSLQMALASLLIFWQWENRISLEVYKMDLLNENIKSRESTCYIICIIMLELVGPVLESCFKNLQIYTKKKKKSGVRWATLVTVRATSLLSVSGGQL